MNYTLKKDGWHFRLQKWVFGKDMTRFDNFCPFFWLTIFCVMVSPFLGMARLVLKAVDIISRPYDRLFDWVAHNKEIKYERVNATFSEEASDWEAYKLFKLIYKWSNWSPNNFEDLCWSDKYYDMKDKQKRIILDRFKAWRDNYSDWQERILTCQDQDNKLKEIFKEKKIKKRADLTKIVARTKLLVWLPIGIFTIYLTELMAYLVLAIIENPGEALGVLIIISGGIVILGVGLYITVKVIRLNIWQTNLLMPRPLKFVGRGIAGVCSFLWMNVKAFKANYCPKIEWRE